MSLSQTTSIPDGSTNDPFRAATGPPKTEAVSSNGTAAPISIVHIITGLSTGGAEMMLYKLLSRTDSRMYEPRVVSLTGEGPIAEKIRALGVPVYSLGMSRSIPNPIALIRLVNWLRHWRPRIVQTWMYHADLIGGIGARLAGSSRVVWGIRNSDLHVQSSKRRTILIAHLCARISRVVPHRIVCCSEASRAVHAQLGYDERRMVVIPNGFDLDSFRPDPVARGLFRAEQEIPQAALVVGLVGRYDPQKDHASFLRAAGIIAAKRGDVHFVLCGDGITANNTELRAGILREGIEERVHLLGRRDDMPRVYAALDVLASASSYGEGFPNVLGEAMACEIPCVVTDVGDSKLIVGDTGWVAPPDAPDRLAEAIEQALSEDVVARAARGSASRRRIVEHFELNRIAGRYDQLHRELT